MPLASESKDVQFDQLGTPSSHGIHSSVKNEHSKRGVGVNQLYHAQQQREEVEEGWLQYIFGASGSNVIHPLSRFGLGWTGVTALFLIYTALVTPPTIAFHWLDEACAEVPTLFVDVVIDCFFIIDIFVNFNLGIIVHGEYVDDRREVIKSYVKGMFLFDCVTSIPVSFFELVAKVECDRAAGQVDAAAGGSQLRIIRAIKPLRWFKIGKVMRLGEFGAVINLLMDYLNVSPRHGKTLKVLVSLTMLIHMMACIYWLWKILGGSDLDEVNEFLDSQPWGSDGRSDLSSSSGKLQAYIISVYVITMTLTTVGYGDISAENSAERVGFVLLFIGGAFIWGHLLAEVADVHRAVSKRVSEKVMSACVYACMHVCMHACMQHVGMYV